MNARLTNSFTLEDELRHIKLDADVEDIRRLVFFSSTSNKLAITVLEHVYI